MTWTKEGGGYVCTCTCGWLRWGPLRTELEPVAHAHQKACEKKVERKREKAVGR